MSKNTNRSLGEGRITKMVKKYAYILDEHLGEVHFPLSAAQHMESSVNDLREKYQSDEHVIFTANKQINQNNEYEYRAVSVVKPRELLTVCGRITDIVPNRFCYTEAKKYGKVFVPFSARLNSTSKHWLGKGAEKNKEVNLKIFPQPQINGCNYVAYSISLPADGGLIETTNKVGSIDAIYDQIGIIVEIPPQPNADLKVFCNVSGFARLPGAFRKPWMTKGRHIKYDAVKQQHPSQEKIHWAIRKCTDLGQLFKKVDENPMKPDSLTLELYAVINRVVPNPPNRCAWFWNDFIGRIYCYNYNYTPGLNVMECVKCKVVYTGAFEDVPWSAYDIELLGEDDDVRFAAAQMLVTRDDWTVTYAENKSSFIGFLESPSMSPQQCFLAWTDLADSDAPPSVGQKCRATVYYQIRKDKQQWRAVLITPLNPNGIPTSNHPLYSGAQQIIWPNPIESPVVESTPATTVSSPSIASFGPPGFDHLTNIPPPIGAGMRPYNSMVKMNGLAKQESSSSVLSMLSNGHERNGSANHQYSHPPPPVNPNSFSLDSMIPLSPLDGLSFSHLHNSDSPRDSLMERNGAYGADFMHMFSKLNRDPFQDFGPSNGGGLATTTTTGSFIGSTADIDTRDKETQTDTIFEHEYLRDVLKNPDCLTTLLKNFPDQTAKIISMTALFR